MIVFTKPVWLTATVIIGMLIQPIVNAAGTPCKIASEEIKQLVELHNQSRQEAGKSPFQLSCKLSKAALTHSKYMAKKERLTHKGSKGSSAGKRAKKAGYQWQAIAENIAHGFTSADATYQGWLESTAHHSNIMNTTYTEIGAARVDDYWTVVLAKPRKK